MIEEIVKTLKTNLAQVTTLFDLETNKDIDIVTEKNLVSPPVVPARDGRDPITLQGNYTISGAEDDHFNAGSLNQTFHFPEGLGKVKTDSFFGTAVTHRTVTAHRVNVGSAMSENVALEMVADEDVPNCALVYLGNAAARGSNEMNSSRDTNINVEVEAGVIFKLDAKQAQHFGIDNLDALYTNATLLSHNNDGYNLMFKGISNRSLVGDNYIVNIKISYNTDLFLRDRFLETLRNYDAGISVININ